MLFKGQKNRIIFNFRPRTIIYDENNTLFIKATLFLFFCLTVSLSFTLSFFHSVSLSLCLSFTPSLFHSVSLLLCRSFSSLSYSFSCFSHSFFFISISLFSLWFIKCERPESSSPSSPYRSYFFLKNLIFNNLM